MRQGVVRVGEVLGVAHQFVGGAVEYQMSELGRISGVKTQAIYKWKQAQPSVASVRKISKALGEDPRRLLVLTGHIEESELGEVEPSTVRDIELAIMSSSVFTPDQKAALIQTARAFLTANEQQT